MKFLMAVVLGTLSFTTTAQTVVGRWQLVKHTSCVEDEVDMSDTDSEALLNDMKSMSGATPQILNLKENNAGEESTRMISKRKSYNSKAFLYKYTGDAIYFLDKRSRTIIEGFTVEKISADSLIITNSSRVCDTKVFIRLK
jgi:hypothetical protein